MPGLGALLDAAPGVNELLSHHGKAGAGALQADEAHTQDTARLILGDETSLPHLETG